jgi:hypothetical protein
VRSADFHTVYEIDLPLGAAVRLKNHPTGPRYVSLIISQAWFGLFGITKPPGAIRVVLALAEESIVLVAVSDGGKKNMGVFPK